MPPEHERRVLESTAECRLENIIRIDSCESIWCNHGAVAEGPAGWTDWLSPVQLPCCTGTGQYVTDLREKAPQKAGSQYHYRIKVWSKTCRGNIVDLSAVESLHQRFDCISRCHCEACNLVKPISFGHRSEPNLEGSMSPRAPSSMSTATMQRELNF